MSWIYRGVAAPAVVNAWRESQATLRFKALSSRQVPLSCVKPLLLVGEVSKVYLQVSNVSALVVMLSLSTTVCDVRYGWRLTERAAFCGATIPGFI